MDVPCNVHRFFSKELEKDSIHKIKIFYFQGYWEVQVVVFTVCTRLLLHHFVLSVFFMSGWVPIFVRVLLLLTAGFSSILFWPLLIDLFLSTLFYFLLNHFCFGYLHLQFCWYIFVNILFNAVDCLFVFYNGK